MRLPCDRVGLRWLATATLVLFGTVSRPAKGQSCPHEWTGLPDGGFGLFSYTMTDPSTRVRAFTG